MNFSPLAPLPPKGVAEGGGYRKRKAFCHDNTYSQNKYTSQYNTK